MRLYTLAILFMLVSCKPLSVLEPNITCTPAYDCEVVYHEETELIEKKDGFNQVYLSHKKNPDFKLVIVKITASDQPIKVQDMPQIMYFFNFKASPETAVKSLKVYKKINCKCSEAGLVQITNNEAKLTYNKQQAYLQLSANHLDLLEGQVKLKL